jgi:hypothetical protein
VRALAKCGTIHPHVTRPGQVQEVEIVAAIKELLAGELEVDPVMLSDADAGTPLLGLGVGLDSIEALRLATASSAVSPSRFLTRT